MRASGRPPRIWIDVEQGAAFGSPGDSVRVFEELRSCFGAFSEAWLFRRTAAASLRGFYYPLNVHIKFGIPQGNGPHLVLIDEFDDQLWLNAAGCGTREMAAAAITVLESLDFAMPSTTPDGSPLDGADEMHFVDRHLATTRPPGQHVPVAPPGKTFVRNGRLACRMDFDKGGVSAGDLRELWTMAIQPDGWLEAVRELTLYDGRIRSEKSGHDGCQLIAGGQSGRELWLRLPEPDDYDRLSGSRRDHYVGAFTEYRAVARAIFATVGVEIDPPDDRPWRERILGRHRAPAEVIHWSGGDPLAAVRPVT